MSTVVEEIKEVKIRSGNVAAILRDDSLNIHTPLGSCAIGPSQYEDVVKVFSELLERMR
jgi:hypothetical protein